MKIKHILIVAAVSFFSLSNYVQADNLKSCTDYWMQKAEANTDNKVEYQNFVEKFCSCVTKQSIETDDALKKALQVCMSKTVLRDAMDTLEDEVGLSEAKDTDVNKICVDKWNIIYTKLTDEQKKFLGAYCQCTQPKLMTLIKDADNKTDKEYYEEIDTIADSCASNLAFK